MAFQVSPGVQVKEIDLTNVVPAVSTSIGGTVGAFRWGPVETPVLVGSEKNLASVFGTPTKTPVLQQSFFTAASFLKYGNALKVVRVTASGPLLNAYSNEAGASGVLIKNGEDYDLKSETFTASTANWIAKYPGALGNSLSVYIVSSSAAFNDAAFDNFRGLFTAAPGTSSYATSVGGSNDELHVVVVDSSGAWTGTVGTVLETFAFLSQARDAKGDDGTSNYYKDVLNSKSEYIWWGSHPAELSNAGSLAASTSFTTSTLVYTVVLGNGDSDTTVNTLDLGDLQTGLTYLSDAETEDVNLLFIAPLDSSTDIQLANELVTVGEQRKDLLAFASPHISRTASSITPLTDVKTWAASVSSSSYVALDSTAVKVYDKYNDVFIWIPANGHVAGLCANADQVADAWFSPAGFNRGNLRGVSKVAYNPKQADRDELYKARINPIVAFPGQGVVLYGDKTALARPSAFDRINVRRLFIVLEKAISTAAKFQLFELNDEFTRAQFRNLAEPFLRDVKGRRGVTDFLVVCDETNNTGQVIDSNRFVADIYIKPARSINFISLNFIATRTGVEFSEIVGQ